MTASDVQTYPTHPVHDWNTLRLMAGGHAPNSGSPADRRPGAPYLTASLALAWVEC